MPPLCLSPSIQVSRIANTMLRATTLPPPKRNRSSHVDVANEEEDREQEKLDREERDRVMKIGDEGIGKGYANA